MLNEYPATTSRVQIYRQTSLSNSNHNQQSDRQIYTDTKGVSQ